MARVLRESLRVVKGPVALVSITQGSEFDNRTAARRMRALAGRIRVEMWREGMRPPTWLQRVCHRQRRGADQLHLVASVRCPDQRERLARWVELYNEHRESYGMGFVDDPFRMRHPKTKAGRPDVRRPKRDMVFQRGEVAGAYLGSYLTGGQLERAAWSEDRSWGLWWVSPTLLHMSGWSMAACRWVRQGWRIRAGEWVGALPSWWYWWPEREGARWTGEYPRRAWVLAVLGDP